jgi:hypothetical protein
MEQGRIAEVGIDEAGRLYVATSLHSFPSMYREAVGVRWDARGGVLYTPAPREWPEWTYLSSFKHIVSVVELQGCALQLSEATEWRNVPPELKEDIRDWMARYRAYLGGTCIGEVTAVNEDTGEITLTYTEGNKTQTFVGILAKGYKAKTKDGSEQKVEMANLMGMRVKAYYMVKREIDANDVKVETKEVLMIRLLPKGN